MQGVGTVTEGMEPWLKELLEAGADGKKITEKQSRIVRAAIEMFAEKGYAASSTSEIAQRAGVAEGTIFRHYKTKKDLLLAIATPALARLIAPFVMREFRGVLNADYKSFDQFLRALIENRVAFVRQNKSLFKILVQELPFHEDLQRQFREAILPLVMERVERILNRFKAEGKLRDLPNLTILRLTASAIFGYMIGHTWNASRQENVWNDEAEREATIEFLVRGLT